MRLYDEHRQLEPAGGGRNCFLTGDASWPFRLGRERHSTNSSARATVEKAAKVPPAINIHPMPPKFRTQIMPTIEHIQTTTSSTQ
jgi:hypothetical protein